MIRPSLSPRQSTQKNLDLWLCNLPEIIKCGDTLLGLSYNSNQSLHSPVGGLHE